MSAGSQTQPDSKNGDLDSISFEDRQDVMRQIDDIVTQSKIRVTPELFSFKAKNKGFVLPLLVNVSTLALLAVGILVISSVFAQRESEQESSTVSLRSAEGLVLEQVRREAQANLAAKDQEITAINDQLAVIAEERNSLVTDMESKISVRETQLRQELNAQLESERQRLRNQGVSEDEITRRIQEFERQQREVFTAQLAAFRRQADEERRKNEAALQSLETEYSQNLTKITQEREQLTSEARRREDQLRQQLLAQQSESRAELTEASIQIQQLSQQRDQERNLAAQINAFYGTIRDQIRRKSWNSASENLVLLRAFLNGEQLNAFESLRQRRDTELFIVESLSNLIDRESRAAETASLVESAAVVTEIQRLYQQGQAAQNQGRFEEAETLYSRAIEQIPVLANGLGFLRNRDQERSQTAASAAAAAARTDAEAQGTLALRSLETEMQQRLAQSAQDASNLESRIQELQRVRTDLESSLAGTQAQLAEVRASLTTTDSQSSERERQLQSQLTAQTNALEIVTRERDRLNTEAVDLRTQLAAASSAAMAAAGSQEQAAARLASLQSEIDTLKAELDGIRGAAMSYNSLLESFEVYRDSADTQGSDLSSTELLRSKVLLDSFLGSEPVRSAFPGLLDRFNAINKAYEATGRNSDLTGKFADLIYTVSSFDTLDERTGFVSKELEHEVDPMTRELYGNLLELITSRPN